MIIKAHSDIQHTLDFDNDVPTKPVSAKLSPKGEAICSIPKARAVALLLRFFRSRARYLPVLGRVQSKCLQRGPKGASQTGMRERRESWGA